jgi:hypothetical protein
MNPDYPVYVISKGRWDTRYTSKILEDLRVSYRIVIEPQEYDDYSAVIDPEKILILPFENLGQGSIPARNWVWEHSISEGHKRHWILDDNIKGFSRVHKSKRYNIADGTIFRVIEDFTDRYENVALSGMHYRTFALSALNKKKGKPFLLNHRVYSCILINNDLSHRWRGRYNEDTDLSLRILKDEWCTVLFWAFLADKAPTMTVKGGNTESLYKLDNADGRLLMVQSLQRQHPDVVKITRKWGRWQHQVDYRPFKGNKLIKKEGIEIPKGVNNYGMVLKKVDMTGGEPELVTE